MADSGDPVVEAAAQQPRALAHLTGYVWSVLHNEREQVGGGGWHSVHKGSGACMRLGSSCAVLAALAGWVCLRCTDRAAFGPLLAAAGGQVGRRPRPPPAAGGAPGGQGACCAAHAASCSMLVPQRVMAGPPIPAASSRFACWCSLLVCRGRRSRPRCASDSGHLALRSEWGAQ